MLSLFTTSTNETHWNHHGYRRHDEPFQEGTVFARTQAPQAEMQNTLNCVGFALVEPEFKWDLRGKPVESRRPRVEWLRMNSD